ncbi:MAG: hypothetical protein Q4B60_06815 [Erysipelotrichaceae bacterium]|nr:hypothetical protein [Erysipelotrichaceae bacterium]
MKKWYKQPYFNRRTWILENFDKLNLNSQETMVILLVDYAKEAKKKLNYEYLCDKLAIEPKELDSVLSNLVAKHYLNINANEKGISFDIDNIFEFDPEKYEVVENTSILDAVSDFLNKPLTPNELMKTKDLLDKYGEEKLLDALRMAEAYRKYTLAYVEGILKNGK